MNGRSYDVLRIGMLVVFIASSGSVVAQTSSSTSPDAREAILEEVIVTSERRAEALNDMAVAGEAFTSATIEKRGILQLQDLEKHTPSLSIKGGTQNRYVTIRGVGLNALTATITSGVAIHVDGLPLWGAGIALGDPFYDLARIEVLRGPQGTFVGQNSTGGAIYIVPNHPRLGETEYSVQQTFGSYAWSDTVAAANLPLTDTTAVRVAVKSQRRDSFYRNAGSYDNILGFDPSARSDSVWKLTTEDTPGDLNEQSVRVKFLWEPSDDLNFTFTQQRFKLRTDGTARQPIYNFANPLYVDEVKSYDDPYLLHYNSPSRFDEDIDQSSVEINWQITPDISFRSLSGIQHFTQMRNEDLDATPHPIMTLWYEQGGADPTTPYMGFPGSPLTETGQWNDSQIGRNRTKTQEINLQSTSDGPLQWAVGLFYAGQENQQDSYTTTLEAGNNRQSTTIMDNQSIQSNRAAFGQITWRLSDQLEVVAGLRYNKDKSENPGNRFTIYRPNPQNAGDASVRNPFTLGRMSEGKFSNSASTGKISVNWHLNDDQIVYGLIGQGYKSGNFNNQNPGAAVQPPESFKPENVFNYEAGWKATMLDGRMHADVTVFQTEYEDYQLRYFEPASNQSPVTNLDKARIKGLELQLRGQFGGLGINLAAATLDSEVVDADPFIDGRRRGVEVELEGRVLPFAPDYTIGAGIEYEFPFGESGTLTPRIQYATVAEQWATIFQLPSLEAGSITGSNPEGTPDGGVSPDYLPSYHTVEASLTWEPNENWMIQLFGTNLSDEQYVSGIAGDDRLYSAPKQYGLRFRYASQ